MITGTLSRYFGMRFLSSVVGAFIGVVALAAMIDYVELMRRGADWPNATAWVLAKISMYRVPQLTERIMPFSVLVGAMSCYLALSRRLELVVARAAGVSAWQFVAPAMIAAFLFGTVATTIYNPISAMLHERSKRLEADMLGENLSALQESTSGFWVRQKSADGGAIINANSSRDQGAELGGVSVYTFDSVGHFQQRIEAKSATLEPGYWRLEDRYNSRNNKLTPAEDSTTVTYDPFVTTNPAVNQLNGRVGVKFGAGSDLALVATNILDTHPVLNEQIYLINITSGAFTVRPRTVGLDYSYHW